jgi:hypothetical protein
VDVLIGFIISFTIFSCYHYYIKTLHERRNWIAKIFLYFECMNESLYGVNYLYSISFNCYIDSNAARTIQKSQLKQQNEN